jgi:hypothetical protein
MFNTQKSELREEATRTVREAVILPLLRRSLKDAVTVCALKKMGTRGNQEEAPGRTIALREEGAHTSETPFFKKLERG